MKQHFHKFHERKMQIQYKYIFSNDLPHNLHISTNQNSFTGMTRYYYVLPAYPIAAQQYDYQEDSQTSNKAKYTLLLTKQL